MPIRLFICALATLATITSPSRAGLIIPTPSGLTAGDHFFVAFVDSTGVTATSTNIADYNADISTAASGITYPGGTIGSWSVIGATSSANEATALFGDKNAPVYGTNGAEIATSGFALLSNGAIAYDQDGTSQSGQPVWTGLNTDGSTSEFPLGGASIGFPPAIVTAAGEAGSGFNNLGLLQYETTTNQSFDLYGYAEFTVGSPAVATPEPSSLTLAFVGIGMFGGVFWRQRRRRTSALQPIA